MHGISRIRVHLRGEPSIRWETLSESPQGRQPSRANWLVSRAWMQLPMATYTVR
jgi:hypothetical protein